MLNNHGELNSDRLVNYAGGGNQLLSIGKLTVNNSPILTFSGGNSYTTRIADTATFNGNAIVNALTNVLFEKGMNYAGGASILDKRGGGSLILRGPANQTGSTIIQGGSLLLRGSEGALYCAAASCVWITVTRPMPIA